MTLSGYFCRDIRIKQHRSARARASEESVISLSPTAVLYRAYEAHAAEKTVLRGSQTAEAVLPAIDACARSRHAGIYARRTQWHSGRSRAYASLSGLVV